MPSGNGHTPVRVKGRNPLAMMERTRAFTFEYLDDEWTFHWYPNRLTGEFDSQVEAELAALPEEERKERIAYNLSRLLHSSDMTLENGSGTEEPYPLDFKHLRELPTPFVLTLWAELIKDTNPLARTMIDSETGSLARSRR